MMKAPSAPLQCEAVTLIKTDLFVLSNACLVICFLIHERLSLDIGISFHGSQVIMYYYSILHQQQRRIGFRFLDLYYRYLNLCEQHLCV